MYTANTRVSLVVYKVHIVRYRIYVSFLVLLCTTNTSDGGRAMYVHRDTAYQVCTWCCFVFVFVGVVCRFFLSFPIIMGVAGAPTWAVSAPDFAMGT